MQTRLTSECFVDPAWRTAVLRPNQAEMSRSAFVALVTGWCGTLCAVLLAAVILRVVS
jgi:bacterioferritin-associated ferredoxin